MSPEAQKGPGARRRWFDWLAGLTLRQRLVLLLSFSALPGLAIAVFLANSWLNDQTRQIGTSVERLAKLAAARNDTVIENARAILVAVAQNYARGDVNAGTCRTYLGGWLKAFPAFTSLMLYGKGGSAICMTLNSEMPSQVEQTAWFKRVLDEKRFVLGQYMVGPSGKALLAAAYPVFDNEGKITGAVALGVDLRWLDFLGKTIKLPEDATISALNDHGELLAHNAAVLLRKGAKPKPPPSPLAVMQMAAMRSGTLRANDGAGEPRVYGVQNTSSGNLVLAVGMPPYLGYARYREALLNTLAAPLMVLILALIAAWYASEAFVTRYVLSLARTAEAIEAGDLSARSEIPYSRYEIGRLAAAFDSMAESIENNQIELQNLAEERETLIRELNHRVKNNLQIVLSMMQPAAGGEIAPEVAQERLKSLASRVQTLAQVHELLYRQYDSAAPPLGSYIEQLTKLLGGFYKTEIGAAEIDPKVDASHLGIGQCINFGLILNELIANAQKHAFAGDEAGARIAVRVAVEQEGGADYVRLIVSDNGIGLPADYDLAKARSMGSRIVRALAKQLNGEIWGERLHRGTAMHFRFPARAAG